MMQWALLGLAILFVFVAYIVIQGTRAALAWRQAAANGDIEVIRRIAEDALGVWRSAKRPKEVRVDVWRGIQSLELVDAGPAFVRVSCQVRSEYKMVGGRWLETRNPLDEGIAVTAKAADMLFYELPHFKPDRVWMDVYTSMPGPEAAMRLECILSTDCTRDAALNVDWEEWTPEEIVDELGGRFRLGDRGEPLPIEVEPPSALDPQPEAEGGAAVAAS